MRRSLYIVEAFVLFIISIFVWQNDRGRVMASRHPAELNRAMNDEDRFFLYWRSLLISWFILYLFLALAVGPFERKLSNYVDNVIENLLNNITCIPFIGMYYELAEKTDKGSNPTAKQLWLPTALFFVLAATVEYSLVGNTNDISSRAGFWASLFSGLISGICTALFVSKLTSRLILLSHISLTNCY
jgi:hypothetical protein